MNHLVTITKSNVVKESFEEEKLVSSLKKVGASPEAIEEIINQVEHEITDGMTTSDIYSRAFVLLRKHSAPMAVKYSIRRAIMELGPDGFPFEKFVARIFRMWGYETATDQTVLGGCIDHEIDVVAWKGQTLAMVEAKYHNELATKSDTKVVLYVKARYDDLADVVYNFGATERKLTERWLFTNTKFTEKAIHYGECNKLKLVGWNYPPKDNLHELIEQNGLHPVTCITSLNKQQKRDLIGRNILVCVDLVGQPGILGEIGVRGAEAERVLTEAQMIIEMAK